MHKHYTLISYLARTFAVVVVAENLRLATTQR